MSQTPTICLSPRTAFQRREYADFWSDVELRPRCYHTAEQWHTETLRAHNELERLRREIAKATQQLDRISRATSRHRRYGDPHFPRSLAPIRRHLQKVDMAEFMPSIYFLVDDGSITYVGETDTSAHARIAAHKKDATKVCDSAYVWMPSFVSSAPDRKSLELELIRFLKPIGNRATLNKRRPARATEAIKSFGALKITRAAVLSERAHGRE